MNNFLQKIVSLFFTDECFHEFFVNLNFTDVECIKQSISKALGTGIILGSTLVKFPQILKIQKAKNAEGISFLAVLLELIGITSAASYSYAKGYPFSSYGESLFLLIETAIVGFMVLVYSRQLGNAYAFATLYGVSTYLMFSGIVPLSVLWSMQIANVPIIVTGKLIQAVKNYQSGHTGQLSSITVIMLFLGSCARIFTSIQETGDPIIILTYVAASVANGVLAAQILYYWESTSKIIKARSEKKE